STSTGWSGSWVSDGGGPKSSAFQRSVCAMFLPPSYSAVLGIQPREPAQRAQARGEAVFPAPGDHERRQALQPPADRPLRDGEAARSVAGAGERVFLGRGADEDAVVQPLRLHELELPLGMGSDEDEDDAAVSAIVLQDPVGEDRAVARAAPQ